jgi:hypothetical protein
LHESLDNSAALLRFRFGRFILRADAVRPFLRFDKPDASLMSRPAAGALNAATE